jgi:hypothetical protein
VSPSAVPGFFVELGADGEEEVLYTPHNYVAGTLQPRPPPIAAAPEQKSPEAIRQERYRAKRAAQGLKEVVTELGPVELEMLAEGCKARGGLDGSYSVAEYLATLIRRDGQLLAQQLGKVAGQVCENCRKPLPRGCGGVFRDEAPCQAAALDRALKL